MVSLYELNLMWLPSYKAALNAPMVWNELGVSRDTEQVYRLS
jgi:hypothetical protein